MCSDSKRRTAPETPRRALRTSFEPSCKSSCVASCPSDWERQGDRCYFWSEDTRDDRKSWFDAEETCKERGGHLASVSDELIHKYMQDKQAQERWIGGFRNQENDSWVWSDCSTWDYNLGWAQHEPNDYHGNEDCVEYYYPQFKWNDRPCSTHQRFICASILCKGF